VSRDYTQANIWFQIRKVLRYTRLYGLSRTLAKVKGQWHMNATDTFRGPRWINPKCADLHAASRNIAIIGCGNYSFSTIAYFLAKRNRQFLRATFDIHGPRSVSLCKAYRGGYAVSEWREILNDSNVKTVFIASNHASHAEYAVECIEAGKHVHIEKPHVVNEEQLERLLEAMRRHPEVNVYLGFNRPRSQLFREVKKIVMHEDGPLMINWFIAGHEIPDDHWYLNEKEGGRVLGNLCHWTDLTLHLVTMERAFPCTIIPATPLGARAEAVVSIIFADQSCASITFSAKGHTFEGVREVLNLHVGNALVNLTDFQRLTYEIVESRRMIELQFREHGHETNILHSGGGGIEEGGGEAISYVETTARFFLAIRKAIESGEKVVLHDNSGYMGRENIIRPVSLTEN